MTRRDRGTARPARAFALTAVLTLPMWGCESSTEIVGAEISAYVQRVSINEQPAELMHGSPPSPGSGPTVTAPASAQAIQGGSTQLQLQTSAPVAMAAVVMEGIDGYWLLELSNDLDDPVLVVSLGSLLPQLNFSYSVSVAGADGVFGPYASTTVNAIEVASGDIQVSVTWDSAADVDLHVLDPTGAEIYYGNTASPTGGVLDIDANAACATSNLRQENIGWAPNTAPNGQYTVRVDYWSACDVTETNFVVTVSLRPGVPQTPLTPGAQLLTYSGTFNGAGTGGGAGDGTTVMTFQF